MREILFRGKAVDTGEWTYGSALLHDGDKCTIFYQHPADGSLCSNEVIPDTLSQSMGLCDENGKKMFEGDIVRYKNEFFYIAYDLTLRRLLCVTATSSIKRGT